ncbi:acyl-CoA dehydrogenase family protein [Parapusillimonas granuli]|uniref:Acyl-CoA dehydrogenase family protein n=1 Tax=Parapusillimonas granuli TaxID=380911 RepID=A0A853FXT0_9BURK|nr:acyl-CoA dehydrogenase family protein [Parapusillimonas granuli]MBB5214693.1 alkylation response protein AidB-like acyl-CoA dehydrogenase [Parapusillimonas granuli]MEB2398059.1 acyl-CoA dehydrogenase family protein [Alcaligenaceae bacterium]NYT48899.1 acyl-CoA dehydrogenase family protein [Parapusillimonas granuli]
MPDQNIINNESDEEFRIRFRTWLEQYYPEHWRNPLTLRLRGQAEKEWLAMLYEHGWRAPSWPREHGGLGMSLRRQLIYYEELARHGTARFIDFGGTLLGPTLIRFGTSEQKSSHLPRILRGETLWCQGYSEPNAGSDLANLGLHAVPDNDGYVLNGSKIWTTQADSADYIFLLARTAQTEKKQDGISFFLADMRTPGISVQPIINLQGENEFSQVFFNDVHIPAHNLVHQLHKGWQVARSLLGVERIVNGNPHLSRKALAALDRLLNVTNQRESSAVKLTRARLACELHNAQALYEEICEAAIRGEATPEQFSIMKVVSSELFQYIADALIQFGQGYAGQKEAFRHGNEEIDLHQIYMLSRPATIYSGTSEIQRNIIARGILG